MDINISAKVFRYNDDASNKNELLELLQTFVGWKLSENTDQDRIYITDKRAGRNHFTVVEPGDLVLTFNNGIANYFFTKPEHLQKMFGISYAV